MTDRPGVGVRKMAASLRQISGLAEVEPQAQSLMSPASVRKTRNRTRSSRNLFSGTDCIDNRVQLPPPEHRKTDLTSADLGSVQPLLQKYFCSAPTQITS
jgi:hypothetical protein